MFEFITFTFGLLLFFQAKHFFADYPLQGTYMLGKFKPGWDFFLPLLAHVGVHGAMTLTLCLWINPAYWWLALVDMSVHFIMDRIKAGPKYLGRYKSLNAEGFKKAYDTYTNAEDADAVKAAREKLRGNVLFWWSLGLDQSVHHLTHYFIIYVLVMDKFLTC